MFAQKPKGVLVLNEKGGKMLRSKHEAYKSSAISEQRRAEIKKKAGQLNIVDRDGKKI